MQGVWLQNGGGVVLVCAESGVRVMGLWSGPGMDPVLGNWWTRALVSLISVDRFSVVGDLWHEEQRPGNTDRSLAPPRTSVRGLARRERAAQNLSRSAPPHLCR